MNIKEAITKLISDNSLSQKGLADKMGLKSQSSIANMISRNDMRVSQLFDICETLGYDIVIKPRYGENKADRTIVISDMSDREDRRGRWK